MVEDDSVHVFWLIRGVSGLFRAPIDAMTARHCISAQYYGQVKGNVPEPPTTPIVHGLPVCILAKTRLRRSFEPGYQHKPWNSREGYAYPRILMND
jgi:hypothetical protein